MASLVSAAGKMHSAALLAECQLTVVTPTSTCHLSAIPRQRLSSYSCLSWRGFGSHKLCSNSGAQQPLPARMPRHCQPGVARCSAAGAASAGGSMPAEDPYKVLGVTSSTPFDKVTIAHRKLSKEADRKVDTAAMERIERAYDSIMMGQLTLRRKGLATGAKQVSKDIRYADRRDYFPWRPRVSRVERNDDLLNMAMAGSMALWIVITGAADYKPFQFLIAAFMFRVFFKLREATPPPSSSSYDEEEEGGERVTKRDQQNGKIIMRTLGLVFGCIGIAATSYTVIVKAFLLLGSYPSFLATGQEKIITAVSAALLYYTASYLR